VDLLVCCAGVSFFCGSSGNTSTLGQSFDFSNDLFLQVQNPILQQQPSSIQQQPLMDDGATLLLLYFLVLLLLLLLLLSALSPFNLCTSEFVLFLYHYNNHNNHSAYYIFFKLL
jgi:hypothetical protein